jgi:nucleoside-diphosphate-sugar epimerase
MGVKNDDQEGIQGDDWESMKKTILLTGATGALGSILLPRLVAEGFGVVCLVRPENGKSPKDRIEAIVPLTDAIQVLQGDIREPDCGVGKEDVAGLRGRIDYVFHCAASLSFTNKREAFSTNVLGIHNVLGLAEALGISDFFHVSTVYVAGDASRFSEQDVTVGQKWRNPYEASKYLAEVLVRSWAAQNPERCVRIFRPSILIGCSDGTTPTFDGWYGYFRPIHNVASAIRRSVSKGKPLPTDISTTNGRVNIPLVLQASASTSLNLVPIDWAADRMLDLTVDSGRQSQTFHLVHPQPLGVRQVIDASLEILHVGGVIIVETPNQKLEAIHKQSALTARLQRQIDAVIERYSPYVTGESFFGTEVLQRTLGADFREPPTINREYLGRLLNYAVSTKWGGLS